MSSIEYSVSALKVPLIVVLGWEKCGAVAAATDVVTKDVRFPGSIGRKVEPIIPVVLAAQHYVEAGQLAGAAAQENVRRIAERLQTYSEPMLIDLQGRRAKVFGGLLKRLRALALSYRARPLKRMRGPMAAHPWRQSSVSVGSSWASTTSL